MATRSIAWAFADACRADHSLGLPDARIPLQELRIRADLAAGDPGAALASAAASASVRHQDVDRAALQEALGKIP